MPQSLSSILIHLVFSTKNRKPFITPTVEVELHPYMATILRELKSPSLGIDGTTDHVHILFKTSTSKWIKTKGREFKTFQWQRGYGSFSIGQSNVAAMRRYIRNQKTHHRRLTFQDEYRKFLKAYGIYYDERYVWD